MKKTTATTKKEEVHVKFAQNFHRNQINTIRTHWVFFIESFIQKFH